MKNCEKYNTELHLYIIIIVLNKRNEKQYFLGLNHIFFKKISKCFGTTPESLEQRQQIAYFP